MRMTLTLSCLCSLLFAPASKAGSLDEEIFRQMPAIIATLEKNKVRNVGVMKFRVQEAGKAARFDAPICELLVQRLEDQLIIAGGPKESAALAVIQNAGQVAGKAMIGPWFTEPAERAKLFDMRYSLRWGDRQVDPDLFLTGKLELGKDGKQTTLTIESFDRKQPEKLVTMATLRVATDREILRDLGYDLSLPEAARSALASKTTVSVEDEDEAYRSAYFDNKKGTRVRPRNIAGIAFDVLVDDEPVPCILKDGRWTLVSPPPKATIGIRLVNQSDKKLAVVLRLNGINTINEQTDQPEHCKKWITKPDGRYLVDGFYRLREKGADLSPFKVLVGAEAKLVREQFGDTAGRIDVDVYEEGNVKPPATPKMASRGLPPSKEKEARASYLALRSALLKSAKLKTQTVVKNDAGLLTTREIIVPDKEARSVESPELEDFRSPRFLQRLTIRVVPAG